MGGFGHYKVTVVGAGNVGATAAQRLVEGNVADVVLVDIVEGMPQGKALDIMQAAPVLNFDARIVGTNGYDETKDSDVVLITAGIARKPGMSRSDLLNTNAKIVGGVVTECAKRSPNAVIVMVSNPLDVMTALAQRISGFDDRRVMGMAGVLDAARFRCFISMELGVSMQDVDAMVLGGHGDSMVPMPRFSTVSGIRLSELMSEERIAALVQRTRDGGAEIVKLLKTGSAYYAPSASAVAMIRSILWDEKRVLPCCVHLKGSYGLPDDWVGVPCRLGKGGLESIVELELDEAERAALHKSAKAVREDIALLG
jgi:malate dehydrogenase